MVEYVNECLTENDFFLINETIKTTYNAGTERISLNGLSSNIEEVSKVKAVFYIEGEDKYLIPTIAQNNSTIVYDLEDTSLLLYQYNDSKWGVPIEDIEIEIKVLGYRVFTDIKSLDPITELPLPKSMHSAIKEYLLWHLNAELAEQTPDSNRSQQYFYSSRYHEKRFWSKTNDKQGGRVRNRSKIVIPPKTTTIR